MILFLLGSRIWGNFLKKIGSGFCARKRAISDFKLKLEPAMVLFPQDQGFRRICLKIGLSFLAKAEIPPHGSTYIFPKFEGSGAAKKMAILGFKLKLKPVMVLFRQGQGFRGTQRTSMSFKSSFWAWEDTEGPRQGFGLLILIWIWTLVQIQGFGWHWRFLTAVFPFAPELGATYLDSSFFKEYTYFHLNSAVFQKVHLSCKTNKNRPQKQT